MDAAAVTFLGAVLQVAASIARVGLAMVLFAVQRDRLYVVISAILLAVLVISLV